MPSASRPPSAAAARAVMRPPIDFPPASLGSSGASCAADATADLTVASRTGGGSGLFLPASAYGN